MLAMVSPLRCKVAFTSCNKKARISNSRVQSTKGFSTDSKEQAAGSKAEAAAVEGGDLDIEKRITRNRRRRERVTTPQVSVSNPQAEAVKNADPLSPESELETGVIRTLTFLFGAVIVEGLVLAGSGFLPEAVDQWVIDVLYPSYSPTVLIFLACSTLYGLAKTGLLPGQRRPNMDDE